LGTIAGEDCSVTVQEALNAIAAYNSGDTIAGETIDVTVVLDAIAAYNSGGTVDACRGETTYQVEITEIVDGDTIDIAYENGTEDTVRLLGVDTPEVNVPTSPGEWPGIPTTTTGREWLTGWGENASAFAAAATSGRTVTIEIDPQADRRGAFGRLLAYVSVNESFQLNYELVERGYARYYQGECRECARYSTAATEARNAERRVWGFSSSDDGPSDDNVTDIELATIRADAPGNDNDNTDEEYVVFQNTGTSTVDLSGWTLADDGPHEFTLPDGVEVGPGERLEVNTGSGKITDAEHVVRLDESGAVWNNGGDTVNLITDEGVSVVEYAY
jgi:micrococcal nuclease